MAVNLQGIVAALPTPLSLQGEVDYEVVERLIDFVCERGVQGIAVAGGTGEYPHFDLQERKNLVSHAARCLQRKGLLLTCIGASSLHKTLALGEHAIEAGSDALLLPMPHFFRYDQHDLKAFCETVCRSLRAPCILYNLPVFTNALEVETAISLLYEEEYVVGIKDSSGNRESLDRYARARAQRDFSLFIGDDALLLEALQRGWDGAISGLACCVPELLVALWRSFRGGDQHEAQRCQALLDRLIEQVVKLPIPWGIRVALEARGIFTGPLPLPLSPIRSGLVEGFRDWFRVWQAENQLAEHGGWL